MKSTKLSSNTDGIRTSMVFSSTNQEVYQGEKRIDIKGRQTCLQCLGEAGESTLARVRGFDLYGMPIRLNFQGEETFKTLPGGCISMVFAFCVIFYALAKGILMESDWRLLQQDVMATGGELRAVHHLGQKDKFGNVSIALEFSKRRPLQTHALTTAALKARSKVEDPAAPRDGKRRLYNFDQFAACLSYESEDDK